MGKDIYKMTREELINYTENLENKLFEVKSSYETEAEVEFCKMRDKLLKDNVIVPISKYNFLLQRENQLQNIEMSL